MEKKNFSPHHPLPRLRDVGPRAQVHRRVRAPDRRPLQLLDLLLDRRRHGRVADVGVDLDVERAPDDARLELEVALVRGDDRAAARNLGPHQLRVDALARGAEGHLLRDDALARVVHLRRRRVAARLAGADPARPELGQAVAGVDALGARGVVDVEVAVGLVLEVDAAERDLFFFFFEKRGKKGGSRL